MMSTCAFIRLSSVSMFALSQLGADIHPFSNDPLITSEVSIVTSGQYILAVPPFPIIIQPLPESQRHPRFATNTFPAGPSSSFAQADAVKGEVKISGKVPHVNFNESSFAKSLAWFSQVFKVTAPAPVTLPWDLQISKLSVSGNASVTLSWDVDNAQHPDGLISSETFAHTGGNKTIRGRIDLKENQEYLRIFVEAAGQAGDELLGIQGGAPGSYDLSQTISWKLYVPPGVDIAVKNEGFPAFPLVDSSVPEPTSVFLVAIGLVSFSIVRRVSRQPRPGRHRHRSFAWLLQR